MDQKSLPFQDEVRKLISGIEQEYSDHNIKFIYVVAFGSRLNQTYFEQSNLNIRGFYVGNKDSYLSVMRPPKEIKINKDLKKQYITSNEFFIDYEFVDIKKYLYLISLPDKLTNDINFWFYSNLVYINQMDPQIFAQLKNICSFPQAAIVGRLIQYSKVFPNLNELNVKEVYYALVSTIQMYSYVVNGRQKLKFPDSSLYQTLNDIKSQFPEEQKLATALENLLKKYVKLKQEKVNSTAKEEDEKILIEYLVQIVEKYKPLQKKQAEIYEKDLKPQLVDLECNDVFRKIFSNHDQYLLLTKQNN